MLDFSFEDICELVTIVYDSDGVTELGSYSFRSYLREMDYFFRICNFLSAEVAHSMCSKDSEVYSFLDTLRSFYWEVEKEEVENLEGAIRRYIEDLKNYKFTSYKLFPFLPESYDVYTYREEIELSIDHIYKRILKLRQRRIKFYERVLEEYSARKDQYNMYLQKHLKSKESDCNDKLLELDTNSVLLEVGIKTDGFYHISNQSWYLKDLLRLENSEVERYTKNLPYYRTHDLFTHTEGLKLFFDLFFVFKNEIDSILPITPDKSLFEGVIAILKRDFAYRFVQQDDLENAIIEHIKELEKYEFFSLAKEQFYVKLSKMIYSLRNRRIAFYEAVLEDYLANREKYDGAI